jgi:hypothetical protein
LLRVVLGKLSEIEHELALALDELRETSRGIHPAVLAEGGLGAALRVLARRSVVPIELDVTDTRLPKPIEVAAYFVVSEPQALTGTCCCRSATTAEVEPIQRAARVYWASPIASKLWAARSTFAAPPARGRRSPRSFRSSVRRRMPERVRGNRTRAARTRA